MNTTPSKCVEGWDFPARPAVDPRAAADEWAWVRARVSEMRREGRLTGQAWSRKAVNLDGETVIVRFEIFAGVCKETDSNNRQF